MTAVAIAVVGCVLAYGLSEAIRSMARWEQWNREHPSATTPETYQAKPKDRRPG